MISGKPCYELNSQHSSQKKNIQEHLGLRMNPDQSIPIKARDRDGTVDAWSDTQ